MRGRNDVIIHFARQYLPHCLSLLQHPEREFMLKFSAIEIYNEAVRDLLSHDTTPLRLLDDPEVLHSPLLELTITIFSSTLP